MKSSIYLTAAAFAAGLLATSVGTASAQSDKTLTIQCTVAGHEHCGERSGFLHRERIPRGHRAFAMAPCRTVIRHVWRFGHRVTVRREVCR